MTIPEILKELELYTGRFPKTAMLAAVEQREAIIPELLNVLEAVALDPAAFAAREKYMLHLFAFYLLAQFRETRAFAPIIKIVSAPEKVVSHLVGDTVTEGLSQILASVYTGDPTPLHALIENTSADQFVRNAAIEAFLILEHTGQISRAEVVEYFRALFNGKLEAVPSFAWDGLVNAVADFPAPELMPEVRSAYQEGLANPGVAGLDELEDAVVSPQPWRLDKRKLITDAIAAMEWWAAFNPYPRPRRSAAPERTSPSAAEGAANGNPPARSNKIGRNEPCPCGSGKKYKKCCLA